MIELRLIYKSNTFKKCKKFINLNQDEKIKCMTRLSVNLDGLDAKFFYGLVSLANESISFEKSLVKFIISVVYSYLKYRKSDLIIRITLDFKSFKNAIDFSCCNFCNVNIQNKIQNVKELRINGVNLVVKNDIIRTWTSIVLKWVNMKRKYEGYWAYFSTLGGAYSSLGEDSYEMAKKAEQTSLKQLRLANDFNDPNSISRCKLFLSFSYVQLAKFQEAKQILRNEYKYLSDKNNREITDERLRIMCIAGIKKLKYSMSKTFKTNNTNG